MSGITYRTNARKALEVILWCANARQGVDVHTILKVLFFADVEHLNEYGRPIVGDDYMALQYGPVAQTTYDLLKGDPLALAQLGVAEVPFSVESRVKVIGARPPDMDQFSQSEIDCLENSWRQYGDMSFNMRTETSHRHPAWKSAWDAGRQRMDYADFLAPENKTEEKLEDLAETAQGLRL